MGMTLSVSEELELQATCLSVVSAGNETQVLYKSRMGS